MDNFNDLWDFHNLRSYWNCKWGITESWLTLILGGIPPLIYYGYMKEGSAGDKLIKKILNGKFGLILVITITVLYIISRIIMLLLD